MQSLCGENQGYKTNICCLNWLLATTSPAWQRYVPVPVFVRTDAFNQAIFFQGRAGLPEPFPLSCQVFRQAHCKWSGCFRAEARGLPAAFCLQADLQAEFRAIFLPFLHLQADFPLLIRNIFTAKTVHKLHYYLFSGGTVGSSL